MENPFMKKIKYLLMLSMVFLCFGIPSAQALMFSALNWDGYHNDAYHKSFAGSETGLGYDIHFLALGGKLTWNENDGGVGINDDEITGGREALLLWYSQPLQISTFELVDLFNEGYLEKGFYLYDSDFGNGLSLDGYGIFEASLWQSIGGEGVDAGRHSVGIDGQVQGILFSAFGRQNDFAVAGYTTPVPEPSTVLLLGMGLIGMAALGRRKFRSR
jgi:hypothetical protein